jgi:membrane dipeptidase
MTPAAGPNADAVPAPIVVDGHEDIAWNVLTFGRDYLTSAHAVREREAGSDVPAHSQGEALLGWEDWLRGRVAVIFATLHAAPLRSRVGAWDRLCYADDAEAHAMYRANLDVYHRLAEAHPERFRIVRRRTDLEAVLATWAEGRRDPPIVGWVILMEGADGVRQPEELEAWWEGGVRILGPAWRGTRYAGGTHEPGPFSRQGLHLLDRMAELGMALDLSHMAEEAVWQALERFPGILLASHSNPRALLPGSPIPDRHLSDDVLRRLAERGGVIGIVPYNKFLRGGWEPADGRECVPVERVAEHIDYVCQVTGDVSHVGLGSDFDGGFGLSMIPAGLDNVGDLRFIGEALAGRGFSAQDVQAVLGGNWLSLLRRALPET